MTPQEMQLEVLQGLHKVNAAFYDEFHPEELDLVLNKIQDKFLEDRIPKNLAGNFQQLQRGLDDVRSLVTRLTLPAVFREDDSVGYGILPGDYRSLIGDSSQLEYKELTTLAKSTVDVSEFRASVKLLDSEDSSQYYKNLVVNYDSSPILTFSDWAPSGLASVEEKYTVARVISEELNALYRAGTLNFQTYYERWRDLYAQETFYFISYDSDVDTKTVEIIEDAVFDNDTFSSTTHTAQKTTTTGTSTQWAVNRLTESEEIDWHLSIPYRKPTHNSPVSALEGQRLRIIVSETSILKGLKINYIRAPIHISLPLNRSCELPEHTHREIVDRTVSHILERVEAKRYKTSKLENIS